MTLLSNDQIDDSVAIALASVLEQRDDFEDMARKVADYCAATLRNPRSMFETNLVNDLFGVVHILDGGARDLGCIVQHVGLSYRWQGISHETLHLILGVCPDDENPDEKEETE